MKQDPIVEEARRIRRVIESECGGDPEKYAARLHAVEKAHTSRLTRRGPVAALRVAEARANYGKAGANGVLEP